MYLRLILLITSLNLLFFTCNIKAIEIPTSHGIFKLKNNNGKQDLHQTNGDAAGDKNGQINTEESHSNQSNQIVMIGKASDTFTTMALMASENKNDKFSYPYSPDSAFNRPIGIYATYSDNDSDATGEITSKNWNMNATNGWSVAVAIADESDAVFTIISNDASRGVNLPYQMRVPTGFPGVPETMDGQVVIYDETTELTHEFYRFRWVDGQPTAAIHRTNDPDISSNPANPQKISSESEADIINGTGHTRYGFRDSVGTRAAGTGGLAGLLRNFELTQPDTYPQHVLALELANEQLSASYRWPASATDSNTLSNIGHIDYGSIVAIPPFEKGGPDLNSLGLTEAGMRVAKALVYYGGIVTDRRGELVGLEGDQYILSSTVSDIRYDINTHLLPHLRILTNADHTQEFAGGGPNSIKYYVENDISLPINQPTIVDQQYESSSSRSGAEYIDYSDLSDVRSTYDSVLDIDSIARTIPANMPLRQGCRVVENIISNGTNWLPSDMTTWNKVNGASTLDHETVLFAASSNSEIQALRFYNDESVVGREFIFHIDIRGTPGDQIGLHINERTTWAGNSVNVTLTDEWTRYSVPVRTVSADARGIYASIRNNIDGTAKTFQARKAMFEEVTGQERNNPSTFTDGIEYSDYRNGNSVDNNHQVVAHQGETISSAHWVSQSNSQLSQSFLGFPQNAGTIRFVYSPQWGNDGSVVSGSLLNLRNGWSGPLVQNTLGYHLSTDGVAYLSVNTLNWDAGDLLELVVVWGGGTFRLGGHNITSNSDWVWSSDTVYDGAFTSDDDLVRYFRGINAIARLYTADIYNTKYSTTEIMAGLFGLPIFSLPTSTGDTIAEVVADGPDPDALTYSIIDGNTDEDITINQHTGELSWFHDPDNERTPSYSLTVQVNHGNNAATANVTIDVN
jgi:hypothetical protein